MLNFLPEAPQPSKVVYLSIASARFGINRQFVSQRLGPIAGMPSHGSRRVTRALAKPLAKDAPKIGGVSKTRSSSKVCDGLHALCRTQELADALESKLANVSVNR